MEDHYYGFMPLFSIMVGAALHLFGLGLFQARLAPLILITLTVALTHRLGAKLFSPWHGTVAVAVLAGWRIAGPFTHLVSGIPLADVARVSRYDSAVPMFGLAALLVLVKTLGQERSRRKYGISDAGSRGHGDWVRSAGIGAPVSFLAIGMLVGLATLSHLYGAFWLPAVWLAGLGLMGRRWFQPVLLSGAGFGLALAPWLLFVVSGWTDFLGQYRNYSQRFGLLDVRFYIINLLTEVERYDPILNGARHSLGAWLWLITCSLSLGWLVYRAIWRQDRSARILVASLGTLGLLFTLLLALKTFTYLATLWPLFALAIAAGLLGAWQTRTNRRWWRPLLALAFCLALLEGGITQWRIHTLARHTTSYRAYTQAIAARLPPDSRILALQHYWLGLAGRSQMYRSMLVPIFWTSPDYVAEPVPFDQVAQAIPANIVLLDQIMLDFLAGTSSPEASLHPLGLEIRAYLAEHQARLLAEVNDPTYGLMQIYRLQDLRNHVILSDEGAKNP
jgi:4-amino-4-deoxy-L-arabinose transferase-like glycosyltransferase